MKHPTCKRQSGISLFEALIALVVISVGVLAIAKLYGEMMASTGESKARAEAIQIAESRVDSLRNTISRDALDAALAALETPQGESITGVNADYQVSATTDQTLDADGQIEQLAVTLDVSWVDVRGETREVTVNSDVYWADPAHAINLARGKLPGGGTIPDSAGDAHTQGEEIDPDEADSKVPIEDFDRNLEVRTKGDRQQIVDVDAREVLLETNNPDGFSVISGFVVGDRLVLPSGNPGTNFRVDLSHAGRCTNGVYYDQDEELVQDLILYRCYVGAKWYGNIGIIDLQEDVTAVAGEVCVGDPTVADGEPRAPAEDARRMYRGVGIPGGTEMGKGLPGLPIVDQDGEVLVDDYGHHFVLHHFANGAPSCRDELIEAGLHLAENYDKYMHADGDKVFSGNLGLRHDFQID